MKLFDSFGQPLEPETIPHEFVGRDWRGVAIYRDDFDDYYRLGDEWVLDDKKEVYDYCKQNYEVTHMPDGDYLYIDGIHIADDPSEVYWHVSKYGNVYYSTELDEVIS